MPNKTKLTPVICITTANSKALSGVLNRNTKLRAASLVKRPGEPMQYRISPDGPDAA